MKKGTQRPACLNSEVTRSDCYPPGSVLSCSTCLQGQRAHFWESPLRERRAAALRGSLAQAGTAPPRPQPVLPEGRPGLASSAPELRCGLQVRWERRPPPPGLLGASLVIPPFGEMGHTSVVTSEPRPPTSE